MLTTCPSRRLAPRLALGLILLALPCIVQAAVFTVTSAADSGAGSLRTAINLANNASDADEIDFNLPGSDPTTITLTTDLPPLLHPVSIEGGTQPGFSGAPMVMLSRATTSTTAIGLDIRASNVAIRHLAVSNFGQTGISISGSGTTGCAIQGCYVGTDTTGTYLAATPCDTGILISQHGGNTIGGDAPGEGNVVVGKTNGITVSASSGNQLIGNKLGLTAAGDAKLGPAGTNSGVGAYFSNNATGNLVRNSSFAGLLAAFRIDQAATSNTLQGNLVGLTADGATSLSMGTYGVLNYASGTKIGGDQPGEGNTFCTAPYAVIFFGGDNCKVQGNVFGLNLARDQVFSSQFAIYFYGIGSIFVRNCLVGGLTPGAGNVICGGQVALTSEGVKSSGHVIQGNWIGMTPGGQIHGLSGNGMNFSGATSNCLIGGTQPGAGNVVTACGGRGIQAKYHLFDNDEYPYGIEILGNRLFGNQRSGIDLLGSHAQTNHSPNDPGDTDDGPNGMQNYPVLTGYSRTTATLHVISGTLDSLPNKNYLVEIYANASLNPVDYADQERFIARFTATTGADGLTTFSEVVPFLIAPGQADITLDRYLTATATDPDGNTSEISPQLDLADAGIQTLHVEDIPTTAELTSGGAITIYWQVSAAGASDLLRFSLAKGGGPIALLASIPYGTNGLPLTDPNVHVGQDGIAYTTVMLPTGLEPRADYQILGESLRNPGIADWSGAFAIANSMNAASGWRGYR